MIQRVYIVLSKRFTFYTMNWYSFKYKHTYKTLFKRRDLSAIRLVRVKQI